MKFTKSFEKIADLAQSIGKSFGAAAGTTPQMPKIPQPTAPAGSAMSAAFGGIRKAFGGNG